MTTEYNRAAQESINLPSDDSGKVDQGKHQRKQTIERRRVIESGNETRVTQNDQIEMIREEEERQDKNEQVEEGTQVKLNKMRREEEERQDKNEQVEEGTQVKLNKLEWFFFGKFHLFFFSLLFAETNFFCKESVTFSRK